MGKSMKNLQFNQCGNLFIDGNITFHFMELQESDDNLLIMVEYSNIINNKLSYLYIHINDVLEFNGKSKSDYDEKTYKHIGGIMYHYIKHFIITEKDNSDLLFGKLFEDTIASINSLESGESNEVY